MGLVSSSLHRVRCTMTKCCCGQEAILGWLEIGWFRNNIVVTLSHLITVGNRMQLEYYVLRTQKWIQRKFTCKRRRRGTCMRSQPENIADRVNSLNCRRRINCSRKRRNFPRSRFVSWLMASEVREWRRTLQNSLPTSMRIKLAFHVNMSTSEPQLFLPCINAISSLTPSQPAEMNYLTFNKSDSLRAAIRMAGTRLHLVGWGWRWWGRKFTFRIPGASTAAKASPSYYYVGEYWSGGRLKLRRSGGGVRSREQIP